MVGLNILSAGSFNINPIVTVSGNDIGSDGNIGSLLVSIPATVNAATICTYAGYWCTNCRFSHGSVNGW